MRSDRSGGLKSGPVAGSPDSLQADLSPFVHTFMPSDDDNPNSTFANTFIPDLDEDDLAYEKPANVPEGYYSAADFADFDET